MKRNLLTVALCALIAPLSASASELGMTSSVGYSYRTGTGSAATYFQTNTQVSETNYSGSIKNSTLGPNDTGVSQTSGVRTISETTLTTGRLEENFSFGNTSRNTFVGVFSR